MKRLGAIVLVVVILYTVYYDLSVGSLSLPSLPSPAGAEETSEQVGAVEVSGQPYEEIKVERGETVLTIVEDAHQSIPVPIERIVRDFEELNEGLKAEEIQAGETYRFPLY
ncbi:hypothetical protein [Bacillus fonticola]|uniref:hypothetical protein n=1 Tax=Bacillus fonticola TaxID=2728853 RepID=UPI0014733624|nr:hypothetical protein [Bacillus fonticola]